METQIYNLICQKCGKEYSLELTESQFLKGKYKHFCSKGCANTRKHSEETKLKISQGVINNINVDCFCKFCGKQLKNKNALVQHEIRCKENPNRIECYGNKGNMPKHTKKYLMSNVKLYNGDVLDITQEQLLEYYNTQLTCEICGKTLNECVKWNSKFAPKHFCIDHDHKTLKFRGLLCSVCNRQLGWYENNKEKIELYLNKNK